MKKTISLKIKVLFTTACFLQIFLSAISVTAQDYGIWKPIPDGVQNKVSISYKVYSDLFYYRFQNNYSTPVYIRVKVFSNLNADYGSPGETFLLPNEVKTNGGWWTSGEPIDKVVVECISIGKDSSQTEANRIREQRCSNSTNNQKNNQNPIGNTTQNFPGAKKSNQTLNNPENSTPPTDSKPQKDWSKSQIIEFKDTYAKTSQVEFSNKWFQPNAMNVRFYNSDQFRSVVFYYVIVMQGKTGKFYTKGSWVLPAEKEYILTSYGNSLEKVIICASETECRNLIKDAFK